MATETPPHWLHPRDIAQARAAQAEMAALLVAEDDLPSAPRRLGGADVSNTRFDPAKLVHAALVTLDADGAVLAQASETRRADFPYVPGYLGFREVPALAAAWSRLAVMPDVLLVDGQGTAHPRGFGMACHLGLVLGVPTIGVAKSLLVGGGEPGPAPGDTAPLLWKGRRIGMALRTRRGAKPLYVSIGHRVSLATAVSIVLAATGGRRLPRPIRAAHDAANDARRGCQAAEDLRSE
ncbi:endonuclease V [Roseomonas sp. HJA6]|uniref:Endonuclease V n=1 Tax=Roseomonas alba TaxID=2846776 RepID=A0ABS7A9V3_9PROT|nr:endonuclease V [Neoroseomonas alba]MBW6398880.1 endonuclease V [Neoroseomonas alba]